MLGEPPDDPLLLFSVLYGVWTANLTAFNGSALCDLGGQILASSQAAGCNDPADGRAPFGTGTSLTMTGLLVEGRAHLDEAIALYDPVAHRSLVTRFGQDARTAGLFRRSMALLALGYPDAALADINDALNNAREIGHVASLFWALFGCSWTHSSCGNFELANRICR